MQEEQQIFVDYNGSTKRELLVLAPSAYPKNSQPTDR